MVDENKSKGESVEDVFDVLELAGRVHVDTDLLSRDFTLAHTDDKLEKLSRGLIYGAKMMHDLLEEVHPKSAKTCEKLLLHEVWVRLIQTRSHGGRVLEAHLKAPFASQPQEVEQEDTRGTVGKLMGMFGNNNQGEQQ